ncbi:MAG TPA: glutamate--tRNA ligase family protein [Candidatus Sulfotelmatobacter sp.]|nr:glutamate--tRNA ligase family protein [Candidatus Sulfotelmatobacter sp.]
MIKVRFAPSPTGIPHIGGTRTALFNFLFAKSQKGEFFLRIEDTDQKRLVKESEKAILEILKWLEIEPTGETIYQSKRLKIYKEYVDELLEKKLAYEKEGAIWVNVSDDKTFSWTDLVGNKKISFNGKDVEDFVILKSDGFPTYHLANVVDDHLTGITHVLRGEEWTSSTPKHLYLYENFGWNPPFFAHLPVILGTDKTKLSKRHGAKSVLDYKEEGYVKEALLNYMALLGWNPGGDKEQMSMSQMEKIFDVKDINTANPIFDIRKLEWLNGVWIRSLDDTDLENRIKEFYKNDSFVLQFLEKNKTTKGIIIQAAKSRMRTLLDFKNLISNDSEEKYSKDDKKMANELLDFLLENLGKDDWQDEKFLAALKNFSKEKNIPFKKIYFLLTKKEQGLGLLELNRIYKKDFFIDNLRSE